MAGLRSSCSSLFLLQGPCIDVPSHTASILSDVHHDLTNGVQLLTFYLERYGSQYISASSELPEPTEGALISSFERVLLTSIPVQDLAMKLGRIACWESPLETAGYAVLYFGLCIFTKVISTVVSGKALLRRHLKPSPTTNMILDPVCDTFDPESSLSSAHSLRSSREA